MFFFPVVDLFFCAFYISNRVPGPQSELTCPPNRETQQPFIALLLTVPTEGAAGGSWSDGGRSNAPPAEAVVVVVVAAVEAPPAGAAADAPAP